jgi:hypothetical protein
MLGVKMLGVKYNLMKGDVVPECTNKKGHNWHEIIKPEDNKSGWHEDLCAHCLSIRCYDTSD